MFKFLLTPEALQLITIGTLGAVVHAFSHLINYRKRKLDYTWKDFVIYTVFGGFAGVMFGLLGQWLFSEQIAVLFFTGMGAFTGFAGLQALAIWTLKKLGVDPDQYYAGKD